MHLSHLTRNENRLKRKDFPSGNERNTENTSLWTILLDLPTEAIAVEMIILFVQIQLWPQRHFGVCSKLKYIIDAISDDENVINNAALVPISSEMRNVMKSILSCLDAHFNGEMNNKTNDIEQLVDNLMVK
ncbi:hypothetical protein TNCV_4711071 [Trichonephila clavipes]|uniref:Uncharacterized protein n=1 Tax=Trichonephila clavipes TaxID=2585209 RepID=A0A8X6VBQ8_TRICX|nr:hypothetical protein TNCV_4711071 [Trichonephila clavipes]